jgi:hypothetical protein
MFLVRDILASWGIQFTNDMDSPSSGATVQVKVDGDANGFADGNGIHTFWTSLISLTEFRTYKYWRVVAIGKNTSTDVLTSARIGGFVEVWHS